MSEAAHIRRINDKDLHGGRWCDACDDEQDKPVGSMMVDVGNFGPVLSLCEGCAVEVTRAVLGVVFARLLKESP